jgi:nitrogen fixation/metabolism regulation signal transduction histidine kinase
VSRFEIKIAFALLLTAAIPLTVALALASRLVDESVTVGLNPRVREAVQSQVPVVRDFIRARIAFFKSMVRALAQSHPLIEAIGARDSRGAEKVLRTELNNCEHCTDIELGGAGMSIRVSGRAKFPTETWAPRTFPSADDPGVAVAGHPQVRLRLTAVLARRYLEGLREAGEFAALYTVLAEKSGAVKRSYLIAFGLALGVTLAVALSVGLFLSRRVTRRIGVLIAATRRVASGDLEFQIPVKSRDEIGDLTQSFNKMLSDLGESQRRIVYLETIATWQEIARRLAHEIKNPLTPILLAVQQLHKKYTGDDETYRRTLGEAMEVVTEEVESLRTLVSEFSDFAKLPAVRRAPGDLVAFVDELARGESAEGVEVVVRRPEGPVMVAFDRMLLRRALTNLLKNAREAMQVSGDSAPPEMSVAVRDGEAVLEVSDRGPGVPEESKARVFDPYFTTKREGTGLGLSIVKKIILDHEGRITVADREGGGAVFRVILPITAEKERAQE